MSVTLSTIVSPFYGPKIKIPTVGVFSPDNFPTLKELNKAQVPTPIRIKNITDPTEAVLHAIDRNVRTKKTFSLFFKVTGAINYAEILAQVGDLQDRDFIVSCMVYREVDEMGPVMDERGQVRYRTFRNKGLNQLYFLERGFSLTDNSIRNALDARAEGSNILVFSDFDVPDNYPYLMEVIIRETGHRASEAGGMFFSYLLEVDEDTNDLIDEMLIKQTGTYDGLERYQIYRESEEIVKSQSHCLVYSMGCWNKM